LFARKRDEDVVLALPALEMNEAARKVPASKIAANHPG
jgi:hypothetical protein